MADPLLLAYIVHNKTSGDKQLSMFDKPLELATRDKTLRTCCKELGIELYEDKKQLTWPTNPNRPSKMTFLLNW